MSWKSFSRTRLPRPPAKPCPRERSPRLPSAAARGRFPQCPDPRLREPRVPRAPFCAARGARPFPCAARGAPALSVSCSIWAARVLQIQKEPDPRGTGLVTPTLPPCPHDERSRECNTYRLKTHPEPTPARPGSGRAAADIGGFRKQNSRSPASFLPSTTYLSWCQRMAFDLSERASGVLLHPTSLPGPHGSGDLGPESHAFARWLRDAGQRWWQMLPVGPIGYGNSPYSAHSAFAGNPLLVNLGHLAEDGLLSPRDLADVSPFPKNRVDYVAVRAFRERHLRTAFATFDKRPRNRTAFEAFSAGNAAWLDDFALYMAIKRSGGGKPWTEWEPGLRLRDPATLDRARGALRAEIQEQRFEQFLFDIQWQSLRE